MYFTTKRTPLQRRPIVSGNFMGTAEIQTVTMEDRKGDMELHNVNSTIKDVFDIAGLLDVLTIK